MICERCGKTCVQCQRLLSRLREMEEREAVLFKTIARLKKRAKSDRECATFYQNVLRKISEKTGIRFFGTGRKPCHKCGGKFTEERPCTCHRYDPPLTEDFLHCPEIAPLLPPETILRPRSRLKA